MHRESLSGGEEGDSGADESSTGHENAVFPQRQTGGEAFFCFFQHVIEEAFLYWLCGLPVGITGIPSYTRALE